MLTVLLIITLLSFSSLLPFFLFFTLKFDGLRIHNLVLSICSTISIFSTLLIYESGIKSYILTLSLFWTFCIIFTNIISWKNKNVNFFLILLCSFVGLINFISIVFLLINVNYFSISILIFGAIILSCSLFSLIVGHSYLDDVYLPISIIKNINLSFLSLLILRLILNVIVIFYNSVETFGYKIPMYEFVFTFEGIFLWVGFLFGIIFPLLLSFLSHRTIKIESTLSATGLLYVLLVCIFMSALIYNYYAIQYDIFM